ncbi:sigma-70 family RNA polymerase sigma factor [Herbiconiux sp. CPCC 205763]|uniref:Sigma-70 family RNA polymerase sigma factor n=1 Tax=Herbiconiux aconitum TaxID=2970913 RepID=A0ABT2GRF2_9MICO|nr:sigma-70 family RNA polymerase sigma factor [Herbiconiux aconitum]MCS5718796.1 sigma-70 family RNA polymerase sigma factor [Herbiconiux aconitum]
MSVSDEADWARVLAGEGDAFGRIFDRHRDRVRRHAVGLAPSRNEAEDVVSLTFLEAWRKREKVRFVDQSILPWLLRTATYTSLNMARSERRHRIALSKLPISDTAYEPSEFADDAQVFAAMRRLSARDQEIITLCVLEELSAEEAASLLGLRSSSARSRLSRARARLRDEMPEPRPRGVRSKGVPNA